MPTFRPLSVGKLAIGDLAEAFEMVAATYGLDVFNDEDGSNFSFLVDSLSASYPGSYRDSFDQRLGSWIRRGMMLIGTQPCSYRDSFDQRLGSWIRSGMMLI